ncbi:MAG: efflux RND transporter periplasmic adaptor subunit, partial [Pseudomonadota bacterium]|nr:efflux RND transporter periplasmic adaptor subunit [Pseudomonadota bacterium]
RDRAAAPTAAAPALPAVRVEALRVDRVRGLTVETRRLGVVEPARAVSAAFDLAGTVAEVTVQEGQAVREGQVIARLDTSRIRARIDELTAQRASLEAQAELARRTAERQETLRERGFASDQRWDEARSEMDRIAASIRQAEAGLAAARIDLSHAELRAPFAGEVAARHVDEGAVIAAGTPVAEVIETGRPRVRVGLPEAAAARLTQGALVEVEAPDAGGPRRLVAAVAALRPDLDPATRTRAALLDLLLPAGQSVAFGRTVEVIAEDWRDADGAWLPLTALREGEKGLWTALVAVPDEAHPGGHVARAAALEVLHVAGDRAFVRGALQDGELVVAAGAHKVAPGMPVDPVVTPAAAALPDD